MIKIASQFSGIGSFEQAITNLGIEHENIMAVDFDKYARQTYTANFGEPKHYFVDSYNADYENVENVDVFLSSPPCQSFSLAGKRLGESDPRGLLFFETLRFINCNKPKYFIIENVKGLLSMDDGEVFRNWIQLLGQSENGNTFMFPHEDSLMYNLHWQVLNTKDYGLPQNRERVFLIGIRNDLPNDFNFPKTIPLKLRLKDILEDEVDEKYYLSDKIIKGFQNHSENMKLKGNGFSFKPIENTESEISSALTARYYKMGIDDNYLKVPSATKAGYEIATEGDRVMIGSTVQKDKGIIQLNNPKHSNDRIYSDEGLCPTLNTMQGGNRQPFVSIGAMRGRNPENPSDRTPGAPTQQMLEINENGTSNCLTSVQKDNLVVENIFPYRSDNPIDSNSKYYPTLRANAGGKLQGVGLLEKNLCSQKEILIFTRNNANGKILLELLEEIGICEIEEWLLGIAEPIEKEEILQQEMYVGNVCKENEETTIGNNNSPQPKQGAKIITKIIMRSLQSKQWYRCSPQRRKSTKQFIRKFTEVMQVLSYETTQDKTKVQSSELQSSTQWSWLLRKALSEIQKIRKSSSNQSERLFRIRKLTPLEAFRLQGFDDSFVKPVSNSQLYKQAGNSISVPVIQAILKNLLK